MVVNSGNQLLKAKNLIVSPHTASMANKALKTSQRYCVEGMSAVLEGRRWPDTVNPEVYK